MNRVRSRARYSGGRISSRARRSRPAATGLAATALALAFTLGSRARGQEAGGIPPTVPAPAAPVAAAGRLTLETAERLALETSPRVKAAEARIRIEEGLLQQAALFPNPDLSLDALRFTEGFGIKETVLSLRQPLPWHGKRKLDRRQAAAFIEAARHDRDRVRLDVLQEVREAFYRIHFTNAIIKVEEEDLEATQSLRTAVAARVAAGDAAPLESLKATVEVSRAANDLGRLRGELEAQVDSFNLLLGRGPGEQAEVAEPPAPVAPADPLPVLSERALKMQPSIAAQEERVAAAAAGLERARLERRPDIAVGPTVGSEEGSSFVGVGLALKIPIWNRSQGTIAAAGAARDEAEAEADAVRLGVRRLVAESYGRYRLASAQQTLYEQGLLDEAAHLLESARKSYEGGESGILELLDARRTALAVREGYYRAALDAALAAVNLRRVVGEDGPQQGAP